jgi:nitrite reductase/ring-hydroxylating ferredoxin subunit
MSAAWTAVATSAAVAPLGRIRVMLAGEERVLWRGGDGIVRLFANRCPHRGMRLSFGFVRGDRLICPYHGWTYGSDGRCTSIPAHPALDPPETIRVETFAVRETAGLIFAAPADTPSEPLPGVDPAGFAPCRSLVVPVAPGTVAAALVAGAPAGWRTKPGDPIRTGGPGLDGGRVDALLAIQVLETDLTAVHAAVAADRPADRIALARWLTALRDGLETAR